MPNVPPEHRSELQRIWEALLRFALSKHVPFHDAEDLVSSALRKGLEAYDSGRGELLSFCTTILQNAIRNHWRDRKVALPIDEELVDDGTEAPDLQLEAKERLDAMRTTIEQLAGRLTDEELQFMRRLGEVIQELGDRAVSETSRLLGLEPSKGWDIFRRIQRKARPLAQAQMKFNMSQRRKKPAPGNVLFKLSPPDATRTPSSSAPLFASAGLILPAGDDLFEIAAAIARADAFERFLHG